MPTHTNFYHILGIRILIIIIHSSFSNFRPRGSPLRSKDNSVRLRVNKFKFKALRLRLEDSQDNKLLA